VPDDSTKSMPAIRFVDYMSGREEMEAVHIIGPYEDAEARNRDLHRLETLPLGAPEFNGGVEFFAATMAEAVGERNWSLFIVESTKVAAANTVKGFFAAFHGYAEEDDNAEFVDDVHPDQTALI
jgi:hypothetical protein